MDDDVPVGGDQGADAWPSEEIELPGGRRMEIRPTSVADAERLASLYGVLSASDRYRRFFTAFEPDLDFCRSWASVGERGGFGVIAVVRAADGEREEVAGEAGYGLRPDGDGDLAVTIAPEWRSWLGAYLVDVLARQAASAGITSLQADVLLQNRPMLAVLRHRGAVGLEHPDGTVRLTIGTGGDVPAWPPGESRPRVLVEVPGGRWSGEPAASSAALATALCSGPGRRGGHACPVLEGGRCPLADEADAIVVLLDPADERAHELVELHRERSPGTPVLVREGLLAPGDASCVTVGPTGEATVEQLLALLGGRSSGEPT